MEKQILEKLVDELKVAFNSQNAENWSVLKHDFTEKLIQYIYERESIDIIQELKDIWEEGNVWRDIEQKVHSKCDMFLTFNSIRYMEEHIIKKYLDLAFVNKYEKFETDEYLKNDAQIPQQTARALYALMNVCENILILQMLSQRRFVFYLQEKFKLQVYVADYLWEYYNTNREKMEKQTCLRKMAFIDMRLKELLNNIQDVKEDVQLLGCLTMEIDEKLDMAEI